jgi:hypothetical protein
MSEFADTMLSCLSFSSCPSAGLFGTLAPMLSTEILDWGHPVVTTGFGALGSSCDSRVQVDFSSLLKKVFEVSRWATLIQDPSARRTKDSQPSGFGFEYCASHVRFRVFQQTVRSELGNQRLPFDGQGSCAAGDAGGLNFFRSIVTFPRGWRPEFALRRPLEFPTVPSQGVRCRVRIPTSRVSS